MKVRFLPLLAVLACSSSVVAQSPFPLPIPTRPTSFPLPIPTLPAPEGYVIASNGLPITLPGKVQGGVRLLRGNVALDETGRAFSIDGQHAYAASLPSGLVDISVGYNSVLALTAAGEVAGAGFVYSYGPNYSQLVSSVVDLIPAEARENIAAIAGGDGGEGGKFLALTRDGKVLSWEAPEYDMNSGVPEGVLREPTPVPEAAQSGVVAIDIAGDHRLALKSNGDVVAWGRIAISSEPMAGMPWEPPLVQYADASTVIPAEATSNAVAIAAGPHSGVVLKSDGKIIQWGKAQTSSPYTTIRELVPPPADLAGKQVVAVCGALAHSLMLAITADGEVYQWGISSMGVQLNQKVIGKEVVQAANSWGGVYCLSLSDDESFSDLVGFPLEKLAQLVAQKILAHSNNYGLATKPDLLSAVEQAASQGEAQGIAAVQSQPNTFGLFDSTQYEANRITGVAEGKAEVTSNPTAYDLFTESSIMDMNLGGLMLKKSANANELDLELTIETKDSLIDNEWQVAERIARKVSMDGAQRQFLRVRADAPYVAPNVKVLAHPTLGNILTDGAGRVLYYFAADSAGGNPLFSGASWPYVTVPEAPKADAGVGATLASSTFGKPGGPYLTVNARPVYTYVGDAEAGQANGHGVGAVWWTIRADGVINQ